MRPFKLAFFTHAHTSSADEDVYDELTRLFVGAEQLGYDAGFVAQHHLAGRDQGRLPAPLVALGPVAAATSRIEIGTSVVVLPIEDPILLAEEAVTLDAISRGRLQLGLGTGAASFGKYGVFGYDAAQRAELFDHKVAVLLAALAGQPLGDTEFRLGYHGTGLIPRLWRSPGDLPSARAAARYGLGALFGTATLDARTQQRPIIDAYLDEWRHTGPVHAPAEVAGTLRPRLGGIRMIYPADSRSEAFADLTDFLESYREQIAKVRGVAQDELTAEDIASGVNLRTGTPAEVAAQIRQDVALLPEIDYLIAVTVVLVSGQTRRGARQTVDLALRGLDRIAGEVAPILGWSLA